MNVCRLAMIEIRTAPFLEDKTAILCPFIISLNLHNNPRQYLFFIFILQTKKLRCGNVKAFAQGHMFSQ